MTHTHTYALVNVDSETFETIREILIKAGYQHAIDYDVIDMHGLALTTATRTSSAS